MAKIYTFKNIQDEVLRNIDEDTNTSTATLTLVKNAINQAHLRRLTSYDWNFMLWPVPITFNTVVNQQTYTLHSEFYKPYYFYNQTVKAYLIEENSRELGPSGVRWNSDTGHASRFAFWGRSPVMSQLGTPSQLVLASDNVSDTGTPFSVTVRGTDSSGLGLITETLTPNGTTPVTGVKTFSNPILNITLGMVWNGNLTLKLGSTVILQLTPGELGRSYPLFYVLSIPNAVDTIEYRFYRQPSILLNDNDIPDIPPPFTQILVYDTLIDIAPYSDTDPKDVTSWSMNRDALEKQMIIANDEANTLESEPRFIRYMGEEPDQPRIYTT